MTEYKIFAINPGSTSTKIALFHDEEKIYSANVSHDAMELQKFADLQDQYPYRRDIIIEELAKNNLTLEGTDAFSGRGGGLDSCASGTYEVSDLLLHHVRYIHPIRHPATLGSQLAREFAAIYGGRAFVVNSPDTDELDDVARITGFKDIYHDSRVHALNQKEIGIRYAKSQGKKYEDMNLIICHIGGGISVTAHHLGRMVDSNDIAQGDGPMTPTRSGSLPADPLIRMCFSGKFSEKELLDRVAKSGGLVDHLNTSDVLNVLEMIKNGDSYAKLVYDAMIYQIAKGIGSCHAILKGQTEAIIFTGGIANDQYLVEKLKDYVSTFAPIEVMAGEFEMEALAAGALRVLKGEEKAKVYTGVPVWNGFERRRQSSTIPD